MPIYLTEVPSLVADRSSKELAAKNIKDFLQGLSVMTDVSEKKIMDSDGILSRWPSLGIWTSTLVSDSVILECNTYLDLSLILYMASVDVSLRALLTYPISIGFLISDVKGKNTGWMPIQLYYPLADFIF